jgi:hypothetical protein
MSNGKIGEALQPSNKEIFFGIRVLGRKVLLFLQS